VELLLIYTYTWIMSESKFNVVIIREVLHGQREMHAFVCFAKDAPSKFKA